MKSFRKTLAIVLVVISLFITVSISSSAANYATDYYNYTAGTVYYKNPVMKNTSAVKYYQRAINYCIINKGLNTSKLDCDSSFGPACKTACTNFQKWANQKYVYSLTVDGSFGPASQAAMKAILNGSAKVRSTNTSTASCNLIWPIAGGKGSVSAKAGQVRSYEKHAGTDIGGCANCDVLSVAAGTVLDAGYNSARGYYVVINHSNGYYCVYQHLKNTPTVKKGNSVKQGQKIGIVGNTGSSQGAHLHFEIAKYSSLTKTGSAVNYLYNDIKNNKKPTYYSVSRGSSAGSYYALILNNHI